MVKSDQDTQSRQWFFTYHIKDTRDRALARSEGPAYEYCAQSIISMFESDDFPEVDAYKIVYELGKTNETPHLHAMWQMAKEIRFSTLKNILTDKFSFGDIHFEPLRSVHGANKYLNKEGRNTWVFGEFDKQGKRSDLSDLASRLVKGEITWTQAKLEKPGTCAQYGKGLKNLLTQSEHINPRPPCEVISSDIDTLIKHSDWIYHGNWNGYDPQKHKTIGIVLSIHMTLNDVKILAYSKNPFVNVGYETIAFTSTKIFWCENQN